MVRKREKLRSCYLAGSCLLEAAARWVLEDEDGCCQDAFGVVEILNLGRRREKMFVFASGLWKETQYLSVAGDCLGWMGDTRHLVR